MTYSQAYTLQIVSLWALLTLLLRKQAHKSQCPFFAYVAFVAIWSTGMRVADALYSVPSHLWQVAYRVDVVMEQLLAAWVAVSLMWEVYFPVIVLSRRTITGWLFAIPTLAVTGILLYPHHAVLALDLVANWALVGCFVVVALQFGSPRVYIKSWSWGVGFGFLVLMVSGAIRTALVTKPGQGDIAMMLVNTAVCGMWGYFFTGQDRPLRAGFPNPEIDLADLNQRALKAKHDLIEMERTEVCIVEYLNELYLQWNAPGLKTTMFVRVTMIPDKTAILAHEHSKMAEIEHYERLRLAQKKPFVIRLFARKQAAA